MNEVIFKLVIIWSMAIGGGIGVLCVIGTAVCENMGKYKTARVIAKILGVVFIYFLLVIAMTFYAKVKGVI